MKRINDESKDRLAWSIQLLASNVKKANPRELTWIADELEARAHEAKEIAREEVK